MAELIIGRYEMLCIHCPGVLHVHYNVAWGETECRTHDGHIHCNIVQHYNAALNYNVELTVMDR